MDKMLTEVQKKMLLKFARDVIGEYLSSGKRIDLPEADGILEDECGAFVTLHLRGRLRGCIGNMIGRGPLIETIREMAIASATADPRFHKLDTDELENVDIEISVLSPMKQIKDVNEIEVGRHGILITRGVYQGVLLPQVAVEYGWDRDTFLEHGCNKAGLPVDTWKDKNTKIEIFSADVFGESK